MVEPLLPLVAWQQGGPSAPCVVGLAQLSTPRKPGRQGWLKGAVVGGALAPICKFQGVSIVLAIEEGHLWGGMPECPCQRVFRICEQIHAAHKDASRAGKGMGFGGFLRAWNSMAPFGTHRTWPIAEGSRATASMGVLATIQGSAASPFCCLGPEAFTSCCIRHLPANAKPPKV